MKWDQVGVAFSNCFSSVYWIKDKLSELLCAAPLDATHYYSTLSLLGLKGINWDTWDHRHKALYQFLSKSTWINFDMWPESEQTKTREIKFFSLCVAIRNLFMAMFSPDSFRSAKFALNTETGRHRLFLCLWVSFPSSSAAIWCRDYSHGAWCNDIMNGSNSAEYNSRP